MDPNPPLPQPVPQPLPHQPQQPLQSGAQPLVPLPAAPDSRNRIVQQIESANNVLVTVSSNPTVDQLAAAIGTTLLLNKLGKHATAVFSGKIPETIEFLQPEKTIEKNTNSLQDFIIALDKSKADKLRYKIEDKFVKIFITPYHTSLSEKDLEFSLGDFNVDVVLALGVMKRNELDAAIVAHGRILHDATVLSINHKAGSDIGVINWTESNSSSLSETMVGVCEQLKPEQKELFDKQISTAFLTGIVAETDRFSNEKTMPQTMSVAGKLMSSGANQQLISDKLKPKPQEMVAVVAPQPAQLPKPPAPVPTTAVKAPEKPKVEAKKDDGELLVPHETPDVNLDGMDDHGDIDKIHIDDDGKLQRVAEIEAEEKKEETKNSEAVENHKMVTTPPSMGSPMSANTSVDADSKIVNPLSAPEQPTPTFDESSEEGDVSQQSVQKPAEPEVPVSDEERERTLADLERTVHSPHVSEQKTPDQRPASLNDLLSQDKGLPPDPTAGSQPGSPPPGPPPIMPIPPSPPNDNNPL